MLTTLDTLNDDLDGPVLDVRIDNVINGQFPVSKEVQVQTPVLCEGQRVAEGLLVEERGMEETEEGPEASQRAGNRVLVGNEGRVVAEAFTAMDAHVI